MKFQSVDFSDYVSDRNPAPGEAAIYVLTGSDGVRYVGSTTAQLRRRLRNHCRWTIGERMQRWIMSLECPPTLRVLMYVPAVDKIRLEKIAVQAHVAAGYRLANTHWVK